jgi:uncharacterized protein (UPF0147 family)
MPRPDNRTIQQKIAAESWRPKLFTDKPQTALDKEIERQEATLREADFMKLSPEARTLARLKDQRRQQLESEDLAIQQAEHLEKNAQTLNRLKALLALYTEDEAVPQGMIVAVEQAIQQVSTLGGDYIANQEILRSVFGAEKERVDRFHADIAEQSKALQAKLGNLRTIDISDYHAAPQRVTLRSTSPAEQANELLQQLTDSSSFGFSDVEAAFEAKRSLRDTGDETLLKAAVSKYATVEPLPQTQEASNDDSDES